MKKELLLFLICSLALPTYTWANEFSLTWKDDSSLLVHEIERELTPQARYARIATDHIDEETSLEALRKIHEEFFLAEVAKYSRHLAVRLVAVERITDIELLEHIAETSGAWSVSDAATSHIKNLHALAVIEDTENYNIYERIEAVKDLTNQWTIAQIAKKGDTLDLRLAAIKCLTLQEALTYIAINASDRKERKAAVQQLTDQQSLSLVVANEKDESIRMDAIKKMTNFNELTKIGHLDKNPVIREIAKRRLDELY